MFDLRSAQLTRHCETVFHHGTRSKAERLIAEGKVTLLSVRPDLRACQITAKVVGSAPQPYNVQILCGEMAGKIFLNGRCTCPMLMDCKHVYAVLKYASTPKAVVEPIPLKMPARRVLLTPPPKPVAPPPPPKPRLPGEWQHWLKSMAGATAATAPGQGQELTEGSRLLFILKPPIAKGVVPIEFAQAFLNRDGTIATSSLIRTYDAQAICSSPRVLRSDRMLARKIFLNQASSYATNLELEGEFGAELLAEILATGNARWRNLGKNRRPLTLGPPRTAAPGWRTDDKGWQFPVLDVIPSTSIILPLSPLWYFDDKEFLCGPLETVLPPAAAREWLRGPRLAPDQSALLQEELPRTAHASHPLPLPARIEVVELPGAKPVPCLRLHAAEIPVFTDNYRRWSAHDDEQEMETINLARLEFDYNGVRFLHNDRDLSVERFEQGKLYRVTRNMDDEDDAVEMIEDREFSLASELHYNLRGKLAHDFGFENEAQWYGFVKKTMPEWIAAGWRIEMDPTFSFRLAEPEAWYTDAQGEGGTGLDWFDTEIGVQLDGQKINLLPLLLQQIQSNPGMLSPETLKHLKEDDQLLVNLPDGRKLPFPIKRVKSLLGVLLELFDPKALDGNGRLRLSKLRAAELSSVTGTDSWRWLGGENLRALSEKLRNFRSIQPVAVPPGLQATLRPYQQEGLNWLQFLREYDLGGILADDMGLGKTIQTLAHLLHEKQSGRADVPSLVIAPTSLMTNWRQETERFAPGLKFLILHGLERKQHFEKLRDYDLIVTSYPLLPRDEAVLLKEQFHLIVLDEAQYIKNPKTKYAQIVCQLRARHHLCLTGTPMENHLGELWSQFNFLLPGFLGDETRFRKVFRNPIEQGADEERRQLLARRIGPFLLRRRKDEVAKELPPKTEIIHNVELSGSQRDLYETIRLAMHAKVRAAVDEKGMSRSHIIILDALLKLRQVCCDPRLVKLAAASSARESAKLELLMDLIPEMLAEGRRILLFSQFTSMLALIQQELDKVGIKYVLLTGDTTNRAGPIEQFQKGEVPLFLISLKAGGTGLNLTTADTVIHYDPWWNPAVENQATDRAHRIGQTKSVFVYKFITTGTVEEKILALQKRKRELVEGLLNEDRADALQLTSEDLQSLFAPIG